MFQPLNELERLLAAAARDPAQRVAFEKAMLDGELFVTPLAAPDATGRITGVRSAPLEDGTAAAGMFTAPAGSGPASPSSRVARSAASSTSSARTDPCPAYS